MKKIKKCIALMLYLFLMMLLFRFDIRYLFDFKEMVMVIVGCVILYIPNIQKGEGMQLNWSIFSRNSIFVSVIQSFVILLFTFSVQPVEEDAALMIAHACRPMLYGLCIWGIFSGFEEKDSESVENNNLECCNVVKQKNDKIELNPTEIYKKILEENGLSRREIEVGMQVIRGMSNSEIATVLCISEATVKKHLRSVFKKMDIERRSQLKIKLDENLESN